LLLVLLAPPVREVAITIDDLPVGQAGSHGCDWDAASSMTERLLKPIRDQHIPMTAFVIGNNCANLTVDQRRTLLRKWQEAGAEIGNHSWSHPDLDKIPIAEYEDNILRGDAFLRETLHIEHVRWFRSPMLHTGSDAATADRLEQFLAAHQWRQALVTLSASDWMFASVLSNTRDAAIAARVRESYIPYLESVTEAGEKQSIPKILLMHANELNAEKMPEVLAVFKRRGYRFVSLEAAMETPLPKKFSDPEEPAWLQQEYKKLKP
jgi:peptidoglycan/xylan/chitin deacetylase (PgdA/CDA1 family)